MKRKPEYRTPVMNGWMCDNGRIVKVGCAREKSSGSTVLVIINEPTAEGINVKRIDMPSERYYIYQSILQRLILDEMVDFEERDGFVYGNLLVVKK